jgi:hypothetical protein
VSSDLSTTRSSPFLRAARVIGDFSNPFYEEERHRDVWNEASAFGFQLLLITALLFSTVCIWLVGRPALPYVQAGVVLTGVISGATILYAQRLGVDVLQPQRLNRARMIPLAVLVVVLVVGMLRVTVESGAPWDRATAAGAVTGAALALAVGAVAVWWTRRAARKAEQGD